MGVRRGEEKWQCSHGDGTLLRKIWGQEELGFFGEL